MWYNYGFMKYLKSRQLILTCLWAYCTKREQNYTLTKTLLLCWFSCFPKWIIFVVPLQSLKEIEDLIRRNIVMVAGKHPRGHAGYWYSLLKPETLWRAMRNTESQQRLENKLIESETVADTQIDFHAVDVSVWVIL